MAATAGWMPATLRAAEPTGRTGRVLHLDVPQWPGNKPGQHLDMRLTADDGYQAERSYSIASSGVGTRVELGVAEVPDGEVSPYLVQDLRVGDQLEVRGPIGEYFVWDAASPRPTQLIAGGSGIVPLYAIAQAHEAAASLAPMRLLYSVREPADAFYPDRLDRLAQTSLRLDWAHTRVAPPGSARPPQHVSADDLARVVFAPTDEPLVFVCGPTGFVEAVADLLVAAGHAPHLIRTERFGGR